jgi:hypothetical protein
MNSSKKSAAAEYVVCITNQDYPASLELKKIYKLVPDRTAAKVGLLRVIDESEEDYLYPIHYFVAIELSHSGESYSPGFLITRLN